MGSGADGRETCVPVTKHTPSPTPARVQNHNNNNGCSRSASNSSRLVPRLPDVSAGVFLIVFLLRASWVISRRLRSLSTGRLRQPAPPRASSHLGAATPPPPAPVAQHMGMALVCVRACPCACVLVCVCVTRACVSVMCACLGAEGSSMFLVVGCLLVWFRQNALRGGPIV